MGMVPWSADDVSLALVEFRSNVDFYDPFIQTLHDLIQRQHYIP